PSVSSFDGWKRLLLLCQDWIASVLAPPPPIPHPSPRPPASYASLVKGPTPSSVGRCSGSEALGCPGISVEKDGTQERLEYLECCVVFRLCSQDAIDWPHFRRWANRNWGSTLNTPLQKLDDDLWLIFCDSKAKVERIISLNRNTFGDIPILLDKWTPEAGRSKVLAGENVVWITIRGIPIHLRSSDLFRQIGSVCGVFLGFKVCSSLSSVRIKIRRAGVIPEVVPINFEGNVFMLSVTSDLDVSLLKEASQVSCSTGKVVLSPLPPSRFGSSSMLEIGSSSSTASPSVCFSDLVSSAGLFTGRTPPDGPSRISSEVSLPSQRTEDVTVVSDFSALDPREGSHFVGMKLDREDNLWIISSSSWRQTTPLVKLFSGLNHFGSGLKLSMGPFSEDCAVLASEFSKGRDVMASSPIGFPNPAGSPNSTGAAFSTHEIGFWDLESASSNLSTCPQSSPSSPPSRRSGSPLPSSEANPSSESDLLSLVVKEAFALFGLELEGSRSLGMEAAIDSCSDISSRSLRSRKDMEWH
ncbi:hypothetical protein LINPERHAP2_LOCUS32712, partial [Linum perenne]